MASNQRNSEMISLLQADFIHKADSAYALALAPGLFLNLPRIAGYWPLSAGKGTKAASLVRDGTTDLDLTAVGPSPGYGVYGLTPFANFNGTTAYLQGANTYYSFTDAFTVGGWFWFTAGFSIAQTLIATYKDTPASNVGWRLMMFNNQPEFLLPVSSSTFKFVRGANITGGKWHFIAGRFTPSVEIAIFADGVKTVNTTTPAASAFAATGFVTIGAQADGGNKLSGNAAQCFACNAALSDIQLLSLYTLTRPMFNV